MMLEIRELRAEVARLTALVEQLLPHQAEKTLWCDWMLQAIDKAAVAEKTRENHRNCARHIREYDATLRIRKHLSFHCARVTCATILIHRGVPLTTIQQILGHRYIGTTQGYAHVTDSTVLKDVKRAWR